MQYITIEREYGSGGTKIARALAQECQIPCYGEEILEAASKNMHMSVDEIRAYEEKATNSILYSLYVLSQARNVNGEMLTIEGKVFGEEQNVIRELAKRGSAIFLGHCASEAIKEYPNVVKIYIHADKEYKHKCIAEEYNIPLEYIENTEKRINKRRATYYTANTQKKWGDIHNYDIVLDSSKLSLEQCVKILKAIL